MPIIENVNGVMKTHTVEFENVGGVIQEKSSVVVNDGGVLRQIHSSGTAIGNLNVGDIVKIGENGTPANYIIVHKGLPSDIYDESCNGVWLLRETAFGECQWDSSNVNDYANSTINAWMNETFLNIIDNKIAEAIKTVKIPYRAGSGRNPTITSGANGLSCKVFLLSGCEVGGGETNYMPLDGVCLSYFSGITATNKSTKRVCNDVSGSTVSWWLRSPYIYNYENVWCCKQEGQVGHQVAVYFLGMASRPAFILPFDFKI